MSSYRLILSSTSLEHNGILGMKWGVRNGPPYPLNAGKHSKSEINAGYKKSLNGKKNPDLYGHKKFELTDKQKQYIKTGATVAAALVVAYAGYKVATNPKFKRLAGVGLDKIKGTPDVNSLIENSGPEIIKKSDFKDIMGEVKKVTASSIIADTKDIASFAGDSGMDCQTGSLAQVLRWKTGEKWVPIAKDVENYSDYTNRTKEIMNCFKGMIPQSVKVDYETISKSAALDGDGTFGFIMCRNNNSGHILPYYVEGNRTIMSSHQLITKGKTQDGLYTKEIFDEALSSVADKAYIIRLDDVEWNMEAIKKLGIVN